MKPPPRWPAAALAGLAAGIVLATLPDPRPGILAATVAFGAALLLREPARGLVMLAALFAVAGCSRAGWEADRLARDPLAGRDGAEVEVRGTILESPRPRPHGMAVRFRVERCEEFPDLPPVDLLVEAGEGALPAAGERWRFTGTLRPLPRPRFPRGFDAGAWLGRQGVHHRLRATDAGRLAEPEGWSPWALACRARLWLSHSLQPFLRPPAHALLVGLMLGESRGLPPEVTEAFRRTGTSHLLAASGLNVAVVVGLVLAAGRLLGRGPRRMALPALAAAAFYALLAGSSPSVVRAAAMAVVGLGAVLAGRRTDALHCLLVAGLAVLLVRPFWLFDVGFQLSMAAVAGLLAYAGPLERRLFALPRWARTSLALSAAATLAVAPVLAWHFQQVSAVSLLANLAMTPVAEALVPAGFAAALLAGLLPAVAGLPLLAVSLALDYLLSAAALLSTVAEPLRVARPGPAALAGCLLGLVWLRLWLAGEAGPRLRLAAALTSLALLAWAAAPVPEIRDGLAVRFADLPGGAAAWVRTPEGREVLLLEDEAARPFAEEVLALHGCGPADGVYAAGEGAGAEIEPGLRVERGEGWLRLTWRRFALLWAVREGPLPPAAVALVPRALRPADVLPAVQPSLTLWPGRPPRREWREAGPWWSTDQHGPLEITTDGATLTWRRWER